MSSKTKQKLEITEAQSAWLKENGFNSTVWGQTYARWVNGKSRAVFEIGPLGWRAYSDEGDVDHCTFESLTKLKL